MVWFIDVNKEGAKGGQATFTRSHNRLVAKGSKTRDHNPAQTTLSQNGASYLFLPGCVKMLATPGLRSCGLH